MSEVVERVARELAATRVYEGYDAETRARLIEREMYGARRDVRFVIRALGDDPAEEALATAEAWLDRWAAHVGSCAGGDRCTCGLTAVLAEVRSALSEGTEQ